MSPNDLLEKVDDQIRDYFAAGVRQVWLISPKFQTVTVYDAPTKVTVLSEEDRMVSEALLPGFRCCISELFQLPPRRTAP